MKLKDSFITHQVADKHILLSTDTKVFSGLVKSNATAAFIIKLLEKETTKQEILNEMKKKYNADEAIMKEDIDKVIAVLDKIGALDGNI